MQTAYLTPEGWARLRAEHQALWARRAETVAALSAAAAEGDRSENAEYIYRKKELRETDRRLRYLDRHIRTAKVVEQAPDDPRKVRFGAWVELEGEDGEQQPIRIVGVYEAEPAAGQISLAAPMARAILGKSVGDEVRLDAAGSVRYWTIKSIRYGCSADGSAGVQEP